MEKSNYSKDIQALIDECLVSVNELSPKTPKVARAIIRKANQLNDDSLKSFAYYHQALYHYFIVEISVYRPLIRKAVYYALKADDQLLLSRIYNFIAVDTHNNGCFDIAYNYYSLAYNYAKAMNDEGSIALIESNLGRLYAELKNYKLARKYLRSSIKRYALDQTSMNHLQNAAILKMNDAAISLMLNDYASSERTLQSVDKLISKLAEESASKLYLSRALLATRLSLKKGEKAQTRKEFKDLLPSLKKEPLVQELIDDISGLYHDLMDNGMKKEAKQLIDSTDKSIMSTGIAYVITQFCELKADYYESVKDDKKLFEVLKVQRKQNIQLRNEQQDMYAHAVSLISLLDSIREEQTKVRSENEALKQIAEIDALTGIPNRFKMNQELNHAYFENKSLAIGILDLDFFKEYNDNYGHQTGDKCLVKVARELSKIAKEKNLFCARFGGDEFVILYQGLSPKKLETTVKEVQDRIVKLKIKHEYSPLSNYVTISQGVCHGSPSTVSSLWDFLAIADEALYTIKKSRGSSPKLASYKIVQYK